MNVLRQHVDTPRNRRLLADILDASTTAPLITVAGPVGSGRSTLLDQLGSAWRERGIRTPMLRLSPDAMSLDGIPVPGRARTVAEDDQLLSALVADGLSSKEIATVLRTSEVSVANRLGRRFSRKGDQSRVELAVVMRPGSAEHQSLAG